MAFSDSVPEEQVLKRELDGSKAPVLRALPAKKPAAPVANGLPLGDSTA